MNREVSRFLLESWQLFYWSFFCPSLLQQRINEWLKKRRKEQRKGIFANSTFLFEINFYFTFQYLFVLAILSLPMAIFVSLSGRGWNWLFVMLSQSLLMGLGFSLPGIGLWIPLPFVAIYSQQSDLFDKSLQNSPLVLAPLSHLLFGVGVAFLFLFSGFSLALILQKKSYESLAHHIFWISNGLSVLFGTWIVTRDWFITISLSGFISFIQFGAWNQRESDDSARKMVINAALLVFFCILLLLWIHDPLIAAKKILVIISCLSLPWFLFVCGLISFECAKLKQILLGILIAVIFVAIGWTKFNLDALWAFPVSLICYYRIFPDYLLACFISLVFNQSLCKWLSLNSASFLTKLPPYTSEFLWFPLPNHSQILADTFRQKNTILLGLRTFQKMQDSSIPGFKLTIQKALAPIVAYRFADVRTTAELIDSVKIRNLGDLSLNYLSMYAYRDFCEMDFDLSDDPIPYDPYDDLSPYLYLDTIDPVTLSHPLLPLIIPSLDEFNLDTEFSAPPKSGNIEIDTLFPILQQTARDTTAALKGGSSALRERGLERLVDQLKKLPDHLPGLGLKPQAVKRWQPAIERWQHILELEIAEQQKTSQGELLNPFQFGNPLRPDRAAIFKGRQDFADRLVRLILDRNRPTLVLHGPRRAGKTSFLLNLPRLLPSDLVPIYLDMQQGSMTASEGDFCYGLVRAIDRDTRSQGLQLPPIPSRQDFYTRPYPALQDWLDLALPKLGERRLLLNLDEFEKIGSAIKDGRISERLFDQLRSMIQHYDRLGFLFSGVQTLEELGPRWSNYFISVVPMEMHYLEPHEAEDLLLHPDPEFTLQYDTGIVEEILQLTRCQPYLLQLIGSAIVNQANLQHTQLATTALLQSAIQSAFTNGEPYFTNIWTEFTGITPAEVTAGQQILIALAQRNFPVETSDESTAAARRRLLRYHVIERGGDIDKIEIPLFEQWVRERSIES
jgi:hypothetical protein